MTDEAPPRGRVVDHSAELDRAARVAANGPEPDPLVLTRVVGADHLPDPVTVFGWLDRASRPVALAAMAYCIVYATTMAKEEDRAPEAWGWIAVTGLLGLAGVKTVERVGPQLAGRAVSGLMPAIAR